MLAPFYRTTKYYFFYLVILYFLSLSWAFVCYSNHSFIQENFLQFFPYANCFLLGSIAFYVLNWFDIKIIKYRFQVKVAMVILLSFLLILILIGPSGKSIFPLESSLAAFLTFNLIILAKTIKLTLVPVQTIFTFIALYSYTIYLAHPLLIDYPKFSIWTSAPLFIHILECLVFAVIVWLVHILIEKPGITLGKQITRVVCRGNL
jgi:peptidoglycan/LPS O-acetylase OafA/YrhL